MEIAACSSDPAAGSSSTAPQCTTTYWTDPYDPLPVPAVTPIPPVSVGIGTLTLGGSGAVSLADNGVYADHLELQVDPSLTQAQLDWLFDHLVYFDDQGNAYTNDVLGQGIGILTLDEAAYSSPQDQRYHVKYGTGDPVSASTAPNEQRFFYTTLAQTTKIGITVIYDSSDTCTGYIANNGSRNVNCSSRGPAAPSINPQASVTGLAWEPTSQAVTGTVAGIQQRRSVQLQVQTAVTDTSANCRPVLSPLAVAPSAAGAAQRPPNYVIDDVDWSRRFPNGLYYVLGAGFGNCDLSAAAPFCEQTKGGQGYVGYIPHYLADGVGGTLNGGSNGGPEVTSMDLADEYELGDVGSATQNGLVFFDGCGYGHRYEEPNVNVSLGTRKLLPDAPNGWTKLDYTVENTSGRALVFGKECCASWYQQNQQTGQNEPAQQLDDDFGMFLPPGASIPYESIFRDEAIAVYDAATGEPLFKLRLDGSNSIVHSCSDSKSSVLISASGSKFTVNIGATGSSAKKCQSIGKCPLAMTASQSGSLVSCTATQSSFLFALNDWKAQASIPDKIQLRAYGANGRDARSGDGVGGAHGFALTVYRPSDLPAALYAYVGTTGSDHGDGGASTILTAQPLSLFGSDVAESTIDPSTMDVLLIAGGGGGDGTKHDGGNGGEAHSNSSTLPGASRSSHGDNGLNDNGGMGGGFGGEGAGGKTAGRDGVGGTSHATNAKWDVTGPLIPPTVDPLSWDAGHGAHGNASAGGGGFGGGGHGSTNGAGAGGGGSWAVGNTAYDSTAPTGRPPSPGGDNGAVELDYVAPTAAVAPAALSSSSAPRNVLRLVFNASVTPLDLPVVVQRLLGSGIGGDVPVYIEAWGGSGGTGGAGGATGGPSGYARTSYTLSDLLAMSNGAGLYLYVGEPGADGEQPGEPGQGGASSIVSLGPIEDGVAAPQGQGLLLISGGGGGGGAGGASGRPDGTARRRRCGGKCGRDAPGGCQLRRGGRPGRGRRRRSRRRWRQRRRRGVRCVADRRRRLGGRRGRSARRFGDRRIRRGDRREHLAAALGRCGAVGLERRGRRGVVDVGRRRWRRLRRRRQRRRIDEPRRRRRRWRRRQLGAAVDRGGRRRSGRRPAQLARSQRRNRPDVRHLQGSPGFAASAPPERASWRSTRRCACSTKATARCAFGSREATRSTSPSSMPTASSSARGWSCRSRYRRRRTWTATVCPIWT